MSYDQLFLITARASAFVVLIGTTCSAFKIGASWIQIYNESAPPLSAVIGTLAFILAVIHFGIHREAHPALINWTFCVGLGCIALVFGFFFLGLFYENTFPAYIIGIGMIAVLTAVVMGPFFAR